MYAATGEEPATFPEDASFDGLAIKPLVQTAPSAAVPTVNEPRLNSLPLIMFSAPRVPLSWLGADADTGTIIAAVAEFRTLTAARVAAKQKFWSFMVMGACWMGFIGILVRLGTFLSI